MFCSVAGFLPCPLGLHEVQTCRTHSLIAICLEVMAMSLESSIESNFRDANFSWTSASLHSSECLGQMIPYII